MDKARKKELQMQYKLMKPPMGVFIVRSKLNNKVHVQIAKDFRSIINSMKIKLETGFHSNKELQKEWTEHGSENFTIDIVENLEYDKDGLIDDYTEDLTLLKMIWEERLLNENKELYKK